MIRAWRPLQRHADLAYVIESIRADDYVSVPDGRCGLVWADRRVWWLGPATRPWRTPREMSSVVGVRIAHLSGFPFSGQPLNRWTDTRTPLADLVGPREAAVLQRRLATSTDEVAAVAALLNYVTSRARSTRPAVEAVSAFEALSGGESVRAIARKADRSVRQVHRQSLATFGMSPTTLRQILRLHRASAVHHSSSGSRLADTAASAGYSDQAHLARECRRLALTSASQALASQP